MIVDAKDYAAMIELCVWASGQDCPYCSARKLSMLVVEHVPFMRCGCFGRFAVRSTAEAEAFVNIICLMRLPKGERKLIEPGDPRHHAFHKARRSKP